MKSNMDSTWNEMRILFMTLTSLPFWLFFNQALKHFCILNLQFPCIKVQCNH